MGCGSSTATVPGAVDPPAATTVAQSAEPENKVEPVVELKGEAPVAPNEAPVEEPKKNRRASAKTRGLTRITTKPLARHNSPVPQRHTPLKS